MNSFKPEHDSPHFYEEGLFFLFLPGKAGYSEGYPAFSFLTGNAPAERGIYYIKLPADSHSMNLAELIREAKKGSAAAQKCLFDQLSGKMLVLCTRYVKNPEAAEEILLDGWYKFFRGLPSFTYEGDAALYAWLKKIMINECLMHLRRKKAFFMVAESAAEQAVEQEDALDRLSATEIFQLIVRLPEGYRTVFNLYCLEGWNHKEISGQLGITEGTSRSQLNKARTLLQKMLIQNEKGNVKRKNE